LQQQLRRANTLVKQAREEPKVPGYERRCVHTVRIKDENGEPIVGEDGKFLVRPCEASPIKGGTVCRMHGGSVKSIKRAARRRLLALVEPAMVRLEVLMEQDQHLPTALGATLEILKRAGDNPIGALKKTEQVDTRPVVNIGIAVGGVPIKPEVKIGLIPQRASEPAEEAEVVNEEDD
jgi:hypothetical protein